MNGSYGFGGSKQSTELFFRKILVGNVDQNKERAIKALEKLGYDVIDVEDTKIFVRRGARGWGRWMSSTDPLDYPSTITVRFLVISDTSTEATFDYSIEHAMLVKDDKVIIEQEVDTIVALTLKKELAGKCLICGTANLGDSKFCRNCGTVLGVSEDYEIELLHAKANMRAAKTSVLAAIFFVIMGLLTIVTGIIVNADGIDYEAVAVLLVLTVIAFLLTLVSALFAWSRIKVALKDNDKPEEHARHSRETKENFATGEFRRDKSLNPMPASVTENTTNLLERNKTEIPRKAESASETSRFEAQEKPRF